MKIKPFLIVIVFLAILIFAIIKAPHKTPLPNEGTPNTPVAVDETAGWKTYTDPATSISYKYPETLGMKYINTVDWPPAVQAIQGTLTCSDAGDEVARAGKTETITVNGNTYCLTRVTEGAAGSIYTQYAYAKEVTGESGAKGTIILTFTLRAPQCDNYDDPQKSECKAEEQSFDINGLMNKVMAPINV